MSKILLNKNKSIKQVNNSNSISIELQTQQMLLPPDSVSSTIDLYETYISERNNCEKYRMIFVLYPYMTNVLFNICTEVVGYDESRQDFFMLTDNALKRDKRGGPWFANSVNSSMKRGLTRYNAIRNTEFSHPLIGNFDYRCGVDIFNNIYLRSNGYFQMSKGVNGANSKNFNTMGSYCVCGDETIMTYEKEVPSEDSVLKTKEIKLHLFNHSNIISFRDAFTEGIKEENGWFGFYNKSFYKSVNHIINDENVIINKCINNKNACDFIDLYPDRTLFSFLPTINEKYNNRIEHNWDWCLTYPCEKVIDGFDFFDKWGIKCYINDKLIPNDKKYVYVRTICKHGLTNGDFIKITYFSNNSIKNEFSVKVYSVGDVNHQMKDYYFTILYSDLADEWGENLIGDDLYLKIYQEFNISKLIKGVPCEYYVRKFKKIEGIKSSLNKAGFAKTIYNDPVAQIIFSDDIDVSNLTNHMGMEVDEVFLTLIKKNKGYKEWYLNGNTSPLLVEASHCFGEVTSGFSFERGKDENIMKQKSLYNIRENSFVERDITIDNTYYYGDFVEFSPLTLNERVIEEIYHRFNTAQREIGNTLFNKLETEELINDDYDLINDDGIADTFKIKKETLIKTNASLMPEGYLYKPHYRVLLRERQDSVSEYYDLNLNAQTDEKGDIIFSTDIIGEYWFITNIPYSLSNGDIIILYYNDGSYKEGYVSPKTNGKNVYFTVKELYLNDDKMKPQKIFLRNNEAPLNSYYIANGSGKRMYRDYILETEIGQTSPIYNRPFTNGAIYINTKVDFFLRRQDPQGIYLNHLTNKDENNEGVYNEDASIKKLFSINSLEKDISNIEYNEISDFTVCGL